MGDGAAAELEFALLGPLEVRRAGQSVPVTAPLQRVVLATMLLDVPRPVGLDRLVDVLWNGAEPRTARVTVQNYVRRLRVALGGGPEAGHPIRTTPGGYLLVVDPVRVDLCRFRDGLDRARAARDRGSEEAVGLYRAALDEWRDRPLPELAAGGWLASELTALADLRSTVVEEWVEAELARGRGAEVVEPLRDLVRAQPLRESARALLVRALHRCGRTGDALDEFRRARDLLVSELGVEPGGLLLAAQVEVLRGADLPTATGPTPLRDLGVVPAQLPAAVPFPAGREDDMAWLDAFAREADSGVAVVTGPPGIGKTTLAVAWARRASCHFPDGQVFLDLRGFDPDQGPRRADDVLRDVLVALGVPAEKVPPGATARAGLYRSLLADRRLLLVLDNARDAEQVRPLLPGAPTCLTVVTSRNRLTPLVAGVAARPLHLAPLPDAAARAFLRGRVGEARADREPVALDDLVDRCGGLPLALAVVAARALGQPGSPLSDLAAQLAASDGLDALDAGDRSTQVRAVFSWSLTASDPAARRLFRCLGVHPGPTVGLAAAASLVGEPVTVAARLCSELTRVGLLHEQVAGRFGMHDLVHEHAAALARAPEVAADTTAARLRVADHYLHSAWACAERAHPVRGGLRAGPVADGVVLEKPEDATQAGAWLDAEREVLLAVVQTAAASGLEGHAWQTARAISRYLWERGHGDALVGAQRTALGAAERVQDVPGQAHAHYALGRALNWLGEQQEAAGHLHEALELFEAVGDTTGRADGHKGLAMLHGVQGDAREALRQELEALALFRSLSDDAGQASALNGAGWWYCQLHEYDEALAACSEAVSLFSAVGDRAGEAAAWDTMGTAHLACARPQEAVEALRRSERIVAALGHPFQHAESLTHLGDALAGAGEHREARTCWERALAMLDELGHPHGDEVRARLRPLAAQPLSPAPNGLAD